MAKIYRTIKKETFIPEKNYFEVEEVKVSREEAFEEVEYSKKANFYEDMAWLVGCGGGVITFIVAIILGAFGLLLFCFLSIAILLPLTYIIAGKFFKISDAYCIKDNEFYNKFGIKLWKDATAEIDEYNRQQQLIAKEWREAHPFEEKIRAVLNDPKSSVDIAEMAYMFADKYLKEKLGD